jgi:hypothetical protein
MRRPKVPALDRETSLACRPVCVPPSAREDLGCGGVKLVVRVQAPRLVRWFAGRQMADRTFDLDSLGREVYDECDGRTEVKAIVRRFAVRHKVSPAEAEISVTEFLRTLMSRGLVAMRLPDGAERAG